MDPQADQTGSDNPASAAAVIWGYRGTAFIVFSVIGVVINVAIFATCVGCIMHLQGQVDGNNAYILFGFLGLMVGLSGIAAIWCLRTTRNLLRYGPSCLTLENGIPEPGGILSARVDCPLPIDRSPVFTITLTCHRFTPEANGTIVWKDSYVCPGQFSQQSRSGCLIPIRFDLPAHALVTGKFPQNSEEAITWSLRVKSTTRGLGYDDIYQVPVSIGGTDRDVPVRDRPPLP